MVEPNPASREDPEAVPAPPSGESAAASHNTPSPHGAANAGGEHTAPERPAPEPTTAEIFAEMVASLADEDWAIDVAAESGTTSAPGSAARPTSPPAVPEASDAPDTPGQDQWNFPVAPWVAPAGPRDNVRTPELEEVPEGQNQFVPPEPTGAMSQDPIVNLAWIVLVISPLGVILGLAFWSEAPRYVLELLGVSFFGALITLLWRMPASRDEDVDGPGAVV